MPIRSKTERAAPGSWSDTRQFATAPDQAQAHDQAQLQTALHQLQISCVDATALQYIYTLSEPIDAIKLLVQHSGNLTGLASLEPPAISAS